MTLAEAQKNQERFDGENWEVREDDFQKIRHITLHMAVLLGKLGRFCERSEHGVANNKHVLVEEVTPDLLIYALQLANLLGLDIEETYQRRLQQNREKRQGN